MGKTINVSGKYSRVKSGRYDADRGPLALCTYARYTCARDIVGRALGSSYGVGVAPHDWHPPHPASSLRPISDAPTPSKDRISYITAATRIVDALERDAFIAPIESPVIPLPHQIFALSRALSSDKVRYLLADEVGLGKTVEAGLIVRELKLRGLIKRVLVVAPTGLVTQWVSEMRNHFNEDFRPVVPSEFATWRKIAAVDEEENLWKLHDQVVCPMDSVKPVDARRGWSAERVDRYNRERFEDLVAADWDLVVIDEAHRMGGSTDRVARYRLGEALSQASPYLLLLSATPHQGRPKPSGGYWAC